MKKLTTKIASYLGKLQEDDYGVTSTVSGAVNYLIDSYFAKIDLRSKPPKLEFYPDDPFAHIKELWLGTDLCKCITLNNQYPTWARNLNAYAFWCLFNGSTSSYDIVPFLDSYAFRNELKSGSRFQIQSEILSIDIGKKMQLPIYGNFFVQCRSSGAHLFVSLDLCYDSYGCKITVMSSPECSCEAEYFLKAMDESIVANDIYYKKCLSYEQGKLEFCSITPTHWDSIVIKDDIRDCIRNNTVGVLENTETLTKLGMCANRNVILISPPGMAKTTIFRAVSHEVESKITRIWCTGKSIDNPENVTQLFAAARSLAPCIIFIEDMDLFGRDRSSDSSINPRILNEFLACLDGAQENNGVAVMASTNDIASMDEALVNRPGRFDTKVEIPLPDAEDRFIMLNKFLTAFHATHDSSVSKEIIKTIIDMTDGLTGDYIKSFVKSVVISALSNESSFNGETVTYSAEDLMASVDQVMKNYEIGKRARKHI